GLITIDEFDCVLTINRAACATLGVTPEQAKGQPMLTLSPTLDQFLRTLDEPGAIVGEELRLRRAELLSDEPDDTYLILGVSVSPLRNNRDQVIGRVINVQDLTQIRAMEANMRKAERLAVVGTLAAGVAHEIRNPLAAISGSIELLRADPRTDEDGRALMDIVTREVDRLNTLITDLLDYTNPQPRQLLRFDVRELLRETLTVFEQDRSYGHITVTLDDRTDEQAVFVRADPSRIRQVLWNLLRNAATAARSRVTIELARGPSQVTVAVADDGSGIDPENLPRVFDPFFTTKARGSGLGLATCHSIITEHGGEIRVTSTLGQGSRFAVELPLDRAAATTDEATEDATGDTTGKSASVAGASAT
ncbi:MAG: ATP-binding protein, partial [Myxococcota bacterium]